MEEIEQNLAVEIVFSQIVSSVLISMEWSYGQVSGQDGMNVMVWYCTKGNRVYLLHMY